MSSTLTPPAAGAARPDPARTRGLRRSRTQTPCPPVAAVEIPRKPTGAEILVLISRARQARVAAGDLDASRLYDLRVYKCVMAELAYYRRLAFAKQPSAHIATSMPQLVKGLARLHPRWDMSGGAFEARDRHHSAVRRRLRVMAACELLTWRAGVNDDGEEARTELLLLTPPAVTPEELTAARGQLARWGRHYGPALNTGSTTGIRDVAKASGALGKAECQMRARNRVQQARAARVRDQASTTKMAPPFGTALCFAEEQNQRTGVGCADPPFEPHASSSNPPKITEACGNTTGARPPASASPSTPAGAVEGSENCSIEGEGREEIGDLGALASDQRPVEPRSITEVTRELEQRVAARLADVEFMQAIVNRQARADEIAAAIAAGAVRRAGALAASDLGRSWPTGIIREAWLVARHGPDAAATGAASAFRLSRERETQLLRVLARYEAHVAEAPAGWPSTGWAAFLHAAAAWQHRYPAGTIEGLDQLTTRMRARATADDLQRLGAAQRRAEGRHLAGDTGPLVFRPMPDAGGHWPAWVLRDPDGHPVIVPAGDQGGRWVEAHLAVEEHHPFLPPAGDTLRRLTERDAFLLAGQPPPQQVDGRQLMRDRDRGHADPSGYTPRGRLDVELLELARLEKRPVAELLGLSADLRGDMLTAARARAARQHALQQRRLLDQLNPPAKDQP